MNTNQNQTRSTDYEFLALDLEDDELSNINLRKPNRRKPSMRKFKGE